MDRKNTEAIQSRKAQLIADLAVARSGLRRDVNEVRQLATVPGQLKSIFKGRGGKAMAAAGAASMAAGSAFASFFKRKRQGSGARSEADQKGAASTIVNDAITLAVDFLMRKGIDRYLKEEWQRAAAKGVLAVLSRR